MPYITAVLCSSVILCSALQSTIKKKSLPQKASNLNSLQLHINQLEYTEV